MLSNGALGTILVLVIHAAGCLILIAWGSSRSAGERRRRVEREVAALERETSRLRDEAREAWLKRIADRIVVDIELKPLRHASAVEMRIRITMMIGGRRFGVFRAVPRHRPENMMDWETGRIVDVMIRDLASALAREIRSVVADQLVQELAAMAGGYPTSADL